MRRSRSWSQGELLAFDLETTGVDRFADLPVSYALVRLRAGQPYGTLAQLVDPGRAIPVEATQVHGITTAQVRGEGVPLGTALWQIIAALVDASRRGVPVVGMKLDFDLTIIDVLSRRLTGIGLAGHGFAGPVVDVLVLDRRVDRCRRGSRSLGDLCLYYGVTLEAAHDAAADATAAAQVAHALCERYQWVDRQEPELLHAVQERWHHRWATSYDLWRREEGLDPLDPDEFAWPVADQVGKAGALVAAG
jgi:DNA polymerase III subunit epsilon